MMRLALIVLPVLLLASCGERQQTISQRAYKTDAKPWQGANDPFVAKGWNPGNQTSWENQIRARGQYQNEYLKVN